MKPSGQAAGPWRTLTGAQSCGGLAWTAESDLPWGRSPGGGILPERANAQVCRGAGGRHSFHSGASPSCPVKQRGAETRWVL